MDSEKCSNVYHTAQYKYPRSTSDCHTSVYFWGEDDTTSLSILFGSQRSLCNVLMTRKSAMCLRSKFIWQSTYVDAINSPCPTRGATVFIRISLHTPTCAESKNDRPSATRLCNPFSFPVLHRPVQDSKKVRCPLAISKIFNVTRFWNFRFSSNRRCFYVDRRPRGNNSR